MASSSSSETAPSMSSIMHMIALKLTLTNYLYWRNQMIPVLTVQNLLSHVDGTDGPPAETTQGDKTVPNPMYTSWLIDDQKTIMVLNASLTEEVLGEIIGLPTARSVWLALETAFSNTSVERIQNLRDQLRHISKGTASVGDFGHRFKYACDQLAAAGQPVDESEKSNLFLRGLSPSFEMFSIATRAVKPTPPLRNLLPQAESYELFHSSIHGSSTPPVAFNSNSGRGSRGSGKFSRGSGWGGRGRGGRRPPHCQLCRQNSHYAPACPRLSSSATPPSATNLTWPRHFMLLAISIPHHPIG